MRYEKSTFKHIFKVQPFEWCSLMSNKTKPNALIKIFFDSIRSAIPENLQKCPLQGQMNAFNFQIRNKVLQIFPAGIYKVAIEGYSKEDPNAFKAIILIKIEN